MRIAGIMMVCMLLSACTDLVESGNKVSHTVRGSLYHTTEKIQGYLSYDPGPTDPQAPQSGYCYKASSDIICYNRPQPQIANKLIGYQEEMIATGQVYTMAPVSQPATRHPSSVAPDPNTYGAAQQGAVMVSDAPVIATEVKGNNDASVGAASGNPQPLMPRY